MGLVVTLLISDLAAVPMQESGMPLLNGLIPILILVSLGAAAVPGPCSSLPWVSRLITGNPITIIRDGQLDQKALKKLRMTVDDLMENLRGMNYYDIKDIQYAIAETNGKISVFMKPDSQPATCKDVNNVPPDNGMPLVIISDGKISQWALQTVGVDEAWIDQVLIDNACPQDKVFLLTATKTREYYLVRKELA